MTAPPTGRRAQPRIAGRVASWWGTLGALTIFSSMHSTLVFASFYYRQRATEWPPEGVTLPDPVLPVAATVLALAGILPAAWAHTAVRSGSAARLQAGALLTAALGVTVAGLAGWDVLHAGFDHQVHAFASVYWVMTGFQLLITVVGIATLLFAPLQVWIAPLSARNRNMTVTAAVLWYYIAGAWAVHYAALHLVPRLW